MSHDFLHLEQANERMIGVGHLLFVVLHLAPAFDGHFHVRLTAAEPYLAAHHILEDELLAVVERERVGTSSRGYIEVKLEGSSHLVGNGFHGFLVPRSRNLHGSAFLGCSLKMHFRALLQHHVRSHPSGQNDVGPCHSGTHHSHNQ